MGYTRDLLTREYHNVIHICIHVAGTLVLLTSHINLNDITRYMYSRNSADKLLLKTGKVMNIFYLKSMINKLLLYTTRADFKGEG